jgi:hypothetical protein
MINDQRHNIPLLEVYLYGFKQTQCQSIKIKLLQYIIFIILKYFIFRQRVWKIFPADFDDFMTGGRGKAKPFGGEAEPRFRRSRQIKIAGRNFYLKSDKKKGGGAPPALLPPSFPDSGFKSECCLFFSC